MNIQPAGLDSRKLSVVTKWKWAAAGAIGKEVFTASSEKISKKYFWWADVVG